MNIGNATPLSPQRGPLLDPQPLVELLLVPHPQLGVARLTDQIDGKTIFKSRFPLFLVYPGACWRVFPLALP